MKIAGYLIVGILSGTACSGTEGVPQRQEYVISFGEFRPSSRTQFDGLLLEVGSGGRLGVIDVHAVNSDPERLYVETILLQRHIAGSPVDATSQVIEVDCGKHKHRTIGNLHYRRDGTLINPMAVETPFTDFPLYQQVYDTICNGSYARTPLATFTSIAGFLDLFREIPPPA